MNATTQDNSASVRILVNDVASNTNVISLPPGLSTTEIEVIVTAPNRAEKSYFITATRLAPADPPPAPTVAPDLIREDDTCPSGIPPAECAPDFDGNPTSKDDNVTTVTRPRFSVPPPGSGETAKLYINGNEVPSSFNSGDNTLRPNAPLPDEGYDITYTLSNSGGESDPSPIMTPQLRILTTRPPPPSGG